MLNYNIDCLSRDSIEGWAFDATSPDEAIKVEVIDSDKVQVTGYANRFRTDLFMQSIGSGRHCFELGLYRDTPLHANAVVRFTNERTGETVEKHWNAAIPRGTCGITGRIAKDFLEVCNQRLRMDEMERVVRDGHWQELLKRSSELDHAYNLFSDEKSRMVFEWYLKFRMLAWSVRSDKNDWDPKSWLRLHAVFPGGSVTPDKWTNAADQLLLSRYEQDRLLLSFNHYSIPGICDIASGDMVVDAGAYDGTSSVHFAEKCGESGRVYAFEPVEKSCKRIEKLKERLGLRQVIVVQTALADALGKMRFSESEGGSAINAAGKTEIECTSLDQFLETSLVDRIDFLKADVEGSELALINGAVNSIRKFRPKMAISAYHKAEDIYLLPIHIKEICSDYKFFLRHHCFNTFELVCYCIC
jgi:FkbM family methyltransferase